MFKWKWDKEYSERFNPLDDATDENVDIAILQAIDSLRTFFNHQVPEYRISNAEFADLLRVIINFTDRTA